MRERKNAGEGDGLGEDGVSGVDERAGSGRRKRVRRG